MSFLMAQLNTRQIALIAIRLVPSDIVRFFPCCSASVDPAGDVNLLQVANPQLTAAIGERLEEVTIPFVGSRGSILETPFKVLAQTNRQQHIGPGFLTAQHQSMILLPSFLFVPP